MNEKRALEKAAIEWFLLHYNTITHKDFRLVCQQERPDAIIEASDCSRFGLEIAHLFYDDLEAKILLGKTKTKVHGPERFSYLVDRLNRILMRKGELGCSYSCPFPISLLIRSASTIFSGPDFESARKEIAVPKGVYEAIWLLARADDSDGWTHLIRLG